MAGEWTAMDLGKTPKARTADANYAIKQSSRFGDTKTAASMGSLSAKGLVYTGPFGGLRPSFEAARTNRQSRYNKKINGK